MYLFFFFNDAATTEIYTLSLHDALPISTPVAAPVRSSSTVTYRPPSSDIEMRSEERRVGKECRFRCAPDHHLKDDPRAEALATAREIAGTSPDAIRAAKRILHAAVLSPQ